MQTFIFCYTIAAIWVFGWMAGTFGLLPSVFVSIILFAPAFVGFRIINGEQNNQIRKIVYLSLVTMFSLAGSATIVHSWFDVGLDRSVILDREYLDFRNSVKSLPEFDDVDISYTNRKGGRVFLSGTVANKASHDRLIEKVERMVYNNHAGYHDGVDFPGKK